MFKKPNHQNQHNENPQGNNQGYVGAPYNFVPLSEKTYEVDITTLPSQDVYHEDRVSGEIRFDITTQSPFYIRCGMTPAQYETSKEVEEKEKNYKQQIKNRPDFFYRKDINDLVIPGTSLRGMLRNLIKIAGFGRIDGVTNRKLFFRDVNNNQYRDLFVKSSDYDDTVRAYETKVRAGVFEINNNKYQIKEYILCRVNYSNGTNYSGFPDFTASKIHQEEKPESKTYLPNKSFQKKIVWVKRSSKDPEWKFFKKQINPRNGKPRHKDMYLKMINIEDMSLTKTADYEEGFLVISNKMPYKHYEFVFLNMEEDKFYDVPEDVVKTFNSDEQITQYQEKAFGNEGKIAVGTPVFFLTDPNDSKKVIFFGRAQNFRYPYTYTPGDYANFMNSPKADKIDLAEAIFGFIQDKKSMRSRIKIRDFQLKENQSDFFEKKITPKILSGPKPTCFQHYLETHKNGKHTDTSGYNEVPEKAKLRGFKLYWHKGEINIGNISDDPAGNSTQHTYFRPVRSNLSFTGSIRFENLSNTELGALLWVLNPSDAEKYCHSLGMGKPLGMGTIKIHDIQVWKMDPSSRYKTLFSGKSWNDGFTLDTTDYILDFTKTMDKHLNSSFKTDPRIKTLLTMMSWPGPDPAKTRYMKIESPLNEYRQRPILPRPEEVHQSP